MTEEYRRQLTDKELTTTTDALEYLLRALWWPPEVTTTLITKFGLDPMDLNVLISRIRHTYITAVPDTPEGDLDAAIDSVSSPKGVVDDIVNSIHDEEEEEPNGT